MGDRGPTMCPWVEQLEVWREDVLKKNLLPGFVNLSTDTIEALSKINDFYCGKHFQLDLAERTKIGLSLWEDEVSDVTRLIGMEALPEFSRWNCQKPAGLHLIRTACELVGSRAKELLGAGFCSVCMLWEDCFSERFSHRLDVISRSATRPRSISYSV